jgi:hypothetical protein
MDATRLALRRRDGETPTLPGRLTSLVPPGT